MIETLESLFNKTVFVKIIIFVKIFSHSATSVVGLIDKSAILTYIIASNNNDMYNLKVFIISY